MATAEENRIKVIYICELCNTRICAQAAQESNRTDSYIFTSCMHSFCYICWMNYFSAHINDSPGVKCPTCDRLIFPVNAFIQVFQNTSLEEASRQLLYRRFRLFDAKELPKINIYSQTNKAIVWYILFLLCWVIFIILFAVWVKSLRN